MAAGVITFEEIFRHQMNQDGSMKIQDNLFKKKFGSGRDEFPLEKNRYRLLWMAACPHAHKVVIARKILGLDKVISLGTTGILRDKEGWVFSEDSDEKDPVLGIHYLKELYLREKPDFSERPTVPIIADTKTGTGVTNDHFWIPIYLETVWKPLHKKNAPELYPEVLRAEIDELNFFIFRRINNGVYDLGFARSQEAYEKAFDKLFEALDYLEDRLKDRRFLFGDYVTDSDVRLYPTLVRFDVVYHTVFRANRNRLADFKNLWGYARDLYQIPDFQESTYFETYKKHYQLSLHLRVLCGNQRGFVAKGPDVSSWNLYHDRAKLSKDPENAFIIM